MSAFQILALTLFVWVLFNLAQRKPRPRKRRRARTLNLTFDGKKAEEVDPVKVGDVVVGKIAPKDKDGFDAKVESALWECSDLASFEMSVAEGGMSVTLKALKPGAALISVKCDADLGEGVEELMAEGLLVCESGKAVSLGLEFAKQEAPPVEPQPEA